MNKSYFSAFRPTFGKTLTSFLLAIVAAIYMAIASFTVGLVTLPFDAAASTPSAMTGDTSGLEDALEKPVKNGVSAIPSAFFKTFLWTYVIWSGFQLISLVRRK